MSIKFFDIIVPVVVREYDDASLVTSHDRDHRMTVRIAMGSTATRQDAVDELARKIESTLNTVDIGDCT